MTDQLEKLLLVFKEVKSVVSKKDEKPFGIARKR